MSSRRSDLVLVGSLLFLLFAVTASALLDQCGREVTPSNFPITTDSANLVSKVANMKKKTAPNLKKIANSLWPQLPISMDSEVKAFMQSCNRVDNPGRRNRRDVTTNGSIVQVDIKTNGTALDVLEYCETYGTVTFYSAQFKSISAELPSTAVTKLATFPDVIFVSPPAPNKANKINTSGGYVSHRVNQLVQAHPKYTGAGIKVGILSDSIDLKVNSQATGDLPSNIYVLSGAQGWGLSEGAAMAELIYDLAPNVTLYFATAFGSEGAYAHNIMNLAAAGCKVIVDNVFYFQEPVFEDGVIAQAVQMVTNQNVLYFSAAGNEGNTYFKTSTTYEADYVPAAWTTFTANLASSYLDVHAFSYQHTYNTITGSPTYITLHWSDPYYEAFSDYDLFVFDANGTLVSFSAMDSIAYEIADTYFLPAGTYNVVVARFFGPVRAISLRFYNAQTVAYSTNGFIFGHAAVSTAFAVGAIQDIGASGQNFYDKWSNGGNPNNRNYLVPEVFTAEGPRKIFYQNGFPVTPNDLSMATGGTYRWKPDIIAADGVQTTVNNFQIYYGTSAAAAHAAGIAAVAAQAYPYLTFLQLQYSFWETNTPALGVKAQLNNVTGFGIPDAVNLINFIASNECSTNPCKNGATCHDWFKSYTCTCATGYCGTTCASPC